ncbi:MAG: flagellar hook protein FlgE [Spirochaetes bacterium GWD1_61_31]|nr:MAG: flagellar hook protein FlgE [Spirochaetes bacterium GWB1_60_80]OHD28519.1 MAG: flagellar hook protein FlgE [Spirochaetes bacterium GWC1_61_12]OHD42181.1 MAG: flagellar hook protein FlgE [Spirochaetes bacterium GWD1_61_31]OHD44511.1 MAG: flagellar hook protein FlgE [Spirochaetes bacterium GWE1_60_18]OHD59337.1 MAG: flagellar hook protein FlgE [Spirochaetes bacterium GWF1_60_12]HAP43166.1 flagellar hook protein FlgE [Spirochaetaceae bacterium]
MMRSLYSGVAGLQNHQIRMDVLGNNIANVNTNGFKKGRVNFQDLLYQQMSGAARPTEQVGGINPKEIGLGMSVASVDTIHTQGSLQTTGIMTDLAIQGNGFFVMERGDSRFFTRAGAFSLDAEGRLVNPGNGFRVQGWNAQILDGIEVLNTSGELQDLVIPIGAKDPARATEQVYLACNLDKRLIEIPEGANEAVIRQNTWRVEERIYDNFGIEHTLRVDYTRVPGQPNQWQGTVAIDPEAAAGANVTLGLGPEGQAGDTFIVQFSNLGVLERVYDSQGNESPTEGLLSMNLSFDVAGSTPDAAGNLERQNFQLNLGEVGSVRNTVTQFAEASSTRVFEQDGYTMGYMENFRIDQSGVITAIYSNGSVRTVGQVALASFTNPNGLEKTGDTNFVESINSGMANIGPSGIAGKGRILAGNLEMSNVDLAEQFTDMIVTQRGFQSNSKTIQTSDQMLQELLQLKR